MEQTQQTYPKNSILGALEFALFMKQATERFHSDISAMWKSFLVPLIFMPLTFFMLYLSKSERVEIAHLAHSEVFTMFLIKGVIGMALSLLIIYGFTKAYDRTDKFFLAITASNWSSLFPTLLFIPVISTYALGWHTWEDIYGISVVFAIYTYCITGFLLTHTLRIPWEMGGFLTICLLAVNETGYDILYWIAGKGF